MDGLVPLETLLGHRFANVDLLTTALTHCSYGNEYRVEHNERLEFLGDAVLSLTVAEHLFAKYPLASEGELSPLRASLVCEAKLAELAGVLNVGAYLRLGVGEQQTGGRNRPRLLASSFEAIVGSLYLDGGIGIVKKFLQPLLAKELRLGSGPAVAASDAKSQTEDAKSRLQEITQQGMNGLKPQYLTLSRSGPDHAPTFVVQVEVNGRVVGSGTGTSKREAEQAAARAGLELLAPPKSKPVEEVFRDANPLQQQALKGQQRLIGQSGPVHAQGFVPLASGRGTGSLRPTSVAPDREARKDSKSLLQEVTQRVWNGQMPRYLLVSQSGPDHVPTFAVQVEVNGRVVGRGTGTSKRDAEQAAARQALSDRSWGA